MQIKNEQVDEIYNRWAKIWEHKENSLETRLGAFSIMQVIKSIAFIYEQSGVLDEEEMDDLFIDWGPNARPVFPEEIPGILESLQKQMKDIKEEE